MDKVDITNNCLMQSNLECALVRTAEDPKVIGSSSLYYKRLDLLYVHYSHIVVEVMLFKTWWSMSYATHVKHHLATTIHNQGKLLSFTILCMRTQAWKDTLIMKMLLFYFITNKKWRCLRNMMLLRRKGRKKRNTSWIY